MLSNVSIIVLNWNGWKDTIECLESIYQIDYPNFNVIVVDNNSNNDSINQIKKYCKGMVKVESKYFKYQSANKPIKIEEYSEESLNKIDTINENLSSKNLFLIKNNKNYGFAKGNNIGIHFALNYLNPDYILLLNNDTVVDKLFLNELVSAAENDKKIGVLGPKVLNYNSLNGDVIDSLGGIINLNKYPGYFGISKNILDKPEYFMGLSNDFIDKTEYSTGLLSRDWISGSSMMIKINGSPIKYLDETYYFGCEDADLCIKMKKEGYKIVTVLNSKIWHKGGKSRKRKFSSKLSNMFNTVSTELKFLYRHNRYFFLFLPIYTIQIISNSISGILKS